MTLDEFAQRIAARTLLALERRMHIPIPPEKRRAAIAEATSPKAQKAILGVVSKKGE